MYGMRKTTLYLPDDLKRTLGRVARERGCSEADVVRDAIAKLAHEEHVTPRIPLFASEQPDLAERVDELLTGFGER